MSLVRVQSEEPYLDKPAQGNLSGLFAFQFSHRLSQHFDELFFKKGQHLTQRNFTQAAEKPFIRLKNLHLLRCIFIELLCICAEGVA